MIHLAGLIHKIYIKVEKRNIKKLLTFDDLSDGEQQLLTVLGLLRFTKDNESLFLLDEPDTHLNPAWKLEYIPLIEQVVGRQETSHIIICTHDPLVIGGLTRKQVQIFNKIDQNRKIVAHPPDIDPKGMGVAAILTSELFGLPTTLDYDTQEKVDRKRELSFKSMKFGLTEDESNELITLGEELGALDYAKTTRDHLYDKFLTELMSFDKYKLPKLSSEERKEQEEIAKKIIDKMITEGKL